MRTCPALAVFIIIMRCAAAFAAAPGSALLAPPGLSESDAPVLVTSGGARLSLLWDKGTLGSNKVSVYEDGAGRRFFVKEIYDPGRAVAEYVGYRVFRLLGIPVPEEYDVVPAGGGRYAVVAPYYEKHLTVKNIGWERLTEENKRLIRLAYYADSLLNTWDRHANNIRAYFDPEGGPRIEFFDWDHTLGWQRWVVDIPVSERHMFLPGFSYYVENPGCLNDNFIYRLERSFPELREEFEERLRAAWDDILALIAGIERDGLFPDAFSSHGLDGTFAAGTLLDAFQHALHEKPACGPAPIDDARCQLTPAECQ